MRCFRAFSCTKAHCCRISCRIVSFSSLVLFSAAIFRIMVPPMNLGRTSSAQILTTVFLVFGTFQPVRGDDISEADSRSQSRTSQESAGKQTEAKVIEQPPVNTTEPWQVTVGGPGWLASASGHSGFHGANPYIDVGIGQLLKNINVVYATSAEVRKGRYGVLGGILYLNAQAGTGERSGLVSKVDLGYQQYFGQLFASYRVIEGPRGWLDLLAGFRYTYLGEQVGLQANNMAIDAASTQLVDQYAQELTSNLRTLIQKNIIDGLGALDNRNPKLPVGPVAGDQKGKILDAVQQVIQSQDSELVAAIRAGAQARVNQLKVQLSNQVSNRVTSLL